MQRPVSPSDGKSHNTAELKQLFEELDSTPIDGIDVDSMMARLDASTTSGRSRTGESMPAREPHNSSLSVSGSNESTLRNTRRPVDAHSAIDDDGTDELHDDVSAGQFIPSFVDMTPSTDDARSNGQGGETGPSSCVRHLGNEANVSNERPVVTTPMPTMNISPDVLKLWGRSDGVIEGPDHPWGTPGSYETIAAAEALSHESNSLSDTTDNAGNTQPVGRPADVARPTPEGTNTDLGAAPPDTVSHGSEADSKSAVSAVSAVRGTATKGIEWYRGRGTRVKVLIAFVAIAVVLTPFRIFGGSESTDPSTGTGTPAAAVEYAETPAPVTPTSTEGVLQPQSVNAECPSGSSRPELALSTDKKDAWVCVRAQGIDGAILTLTFRRPVVITEVSLVPGFNYVEASGVDRWTEHRLPSKLLWTFNDDTELVQDIAPTRTNASMKVNAVATQSVSLTVMQTVSPDADQPGSDLPFTIPTPADTDSFALSQLQITGHEA